MEETKILIKNARVLDAESKTDSILDLLVEGSTIKAIDKPGSFSTLSNLQIIDGTGQWLLPGLIDLHVHLREPGQEWKETIHSGSAAAISGGYTTICAMPNTKPVNDSLEITKYIKEKALQANLAKVVPIGAVSHNLEGKQMSSLSELYHAGCLAFSDDGQPIYDSGLMRRALEWCRMTDAVICCHEEDKCLSCSGAMNESAISYKLGLPGMSTIAEDVMVARDIELARFTGGRVHICHISSERGVELIRRAKNDGINITCEVTPHHLTLTEDCLKDYDTNYKMSPPLRSEKTRQALIAGIKDGTIDCIASDHAPHEFDSKNTSFPQASMGILGLQTSLPLMLEFCEQKIITPLQLVSLLATNPAKIFKMSQGQIKVGAPADLILLDPKKEWAFTRDNNFSKSFNSPFLNRKLKGECSVVLVDGQIKNVQKDK